MGTLREYARLQEVKSVKPYENKKADTKTAREIIESVRADGRTASQKLKLNAFSCPTVCLLSQLNWQNPKMKPSNLQKPTAIPSF